MKRSITGAMFYYHEGAFFTSEKCRARVKKWEERPLEIKNLDSVKKKFLREIEDVTGKNLNPNELDFIEPHYIKYEIRPLFFYCSNNECGWNIKFNDLDSLSRFIEKKNGLICERCGSNLIQSGHVFACICANISDIKERYCPNHKNQKMDFIRPSIYDISQWKYRCRICGREEPLQMFCDNCGRRMNLKSTEGSGLTTPLSFTTPSFETPDYKWIAQYLNIDVEDELRRFEDLKNEFPDIEIRYLKKKIEEILKKHFDDHIYVLERLADYASIYTNVEASKKYQDLGITFHRTDRINLVKGVYAYIVNEFQPKKGETVFKFFIHDGRYKILTNVIENTEGILLEFDKNKIVDWLYTNEFIETKPLTENFNLWFLQKGAKSDSYVRKQIYTLLHTISHGFMVSMHTISGISIDSVSELIFPEIPAVLIYTNYTTSIGHLESLFENMLDEWISKTKDDTIKNCVHDPLCIKEDHACAGCLMISEVVCCDFNNSLDRRYVVGWDNIKGYWE